MKVLIFSTYFLPVVGGVQTYVKLLAQGLSEWGKTSDIKDQVEVTVATEIPGSDQEDASFPYRIVRRPGFWALRKLIAEADLVHLAGPSLLPMALAWLMRKPFTVEQHGYQAICPNGLLFLQPEKSVCRGYFLMKRYGRCIKCRSVEIGRFPAVRSLLLTFPRHWLCNRAAANIAITDHVKVRLGLQRTRTIYYGLEIPHAVSSPKGASLVLPDRLTVAYVGRLVAEKGLPLLLHAARRLKEERVAFRLLFVGDGPERALLHSIAKELKIEDCVSFTGDLRNQELDRAVRDISVVVMPSIWEETAGLSAIEQMMRGGVVIAADIGGLSEVVGDAGLKFPPHDWNALASCIQKLAEDPAKRAALGAAARERAREKFTIDRMTREHVSVFAENTVPPGADR
jgi:glycosyltransferase involved in cell wall biosynthesis